MNKRGFTFIETIITTIILLTALLMLYSSFSSTIKLEKKRLYYDDVSTVYKALSIRQALNEGLSSQTILSEKLSSSGKYIYFFNYGTNIFSDYTVLEKMYNELHFEALGVFNASDLLTIKTCLKSDSKCSNIYEYEDLLTYLKTINIEDKTRMILIVMIYENKNGDAGSISKNGYNDCIYEYTKNKYGSGTDDSENYTNVLNLYHKDGDYSVDMKCENSIRFAWVYL